LPLQVLFLIESPSLDRNKPILRGIPMYFDDLKIGMSVDTAPVVIKKEKMLAFASEYDNIPIHTDEKYAKGTHFGGLIAPGVMSFMSVWAKYLEVDFFGNALVEITVGVFNQNDELVIKNVTEAIVKCKCRM